MINGMVNYFEKEGESEYISISYIHNIKSRGNNMSLEVTHLIVITPSLDITY